MLINQISVEDEDYADVLFWRSKSIAERLEEVMRLRKNYYTWLEGSFPLKMGKIISQKLTDFSNDFIKNKEATGRTKDMADVEALRKPGNK